MHLPFTKMHGAGNDFVVLDARAAPIPLAPAQAAALADRRRGIGCDQIIVVEPAPPGADAFMRFLNADGSEAGACGNGTRCAASLLLDGRAGGHDSLAIQTNAGTLAAERVADGRVRVDMGPPRLGWQDVPLAHEADTLHLPMTGDPAACSMGNPHATFFTRDVDLAERLGPALERHPLFPERANIGFAEVLAPGRIRLRVWERGAGLTLACGSGACAALVNAHRRGLAGREAEIVMDGGTLGIHWREADGHVLMTGPVATSFRGVVEL
jgi:diaminopimelate epimerase